MPAPDDLTDRYECVVSAVAAVPAGQRELLLAKAVLLLARRLDSVDELRDLLADATHDLPAEAQP